MSNKTQKFSIQLKNLYPEIQIKTFITWTYVKSFHFHVH